MANEPLFLDTTIQVERSVGTEHPEMAPAIDELLAGYGFFLSCGFSRLEFKRVVIQNLWLILTYINERDTKSFVNALIRTTGLQQARRKNTLASILAWIERKVDRKIELALGESADEKLGIQAEAYIRVAIRSLWIWFDKKVDHVADRLDCRRAQEGPKPNPDGTLDVHIPQSQCRKKQCNNANFFREQMPILRKLARSLAKLETQGKELTTELKAAKRAIESALSNPERLYDYTRCLELADVWIHLESLAAGVKDFATTNYKESQVLCPLLGLEMRRPLQADPAAR
jgi:hypothetical protein